jgi:hypothetical protein
VRGQPIPEQAKASIERFLAAIRAADTTRVDGFLELGMGYDTNVNAATSAAQVALPALGGVIATLDPLTTRRGDGFGALAGGINVTHKLSEMWALVGNASGSARLHPHEDQFDQMTLDASLGARWSRGRDAISLGGQLQSFQLDYARYRRGRRRGGAMAAFLRRQPPDLALRAARAPALSDAEYSRCRPRRARHSLRPRVPRCATLPWSSAARTPGASGSSRRRIPTSVTICGACGSALR